MQFDRDEFAGLVERALAELPEQFSSHMENVDIEVRDRPGRAMLRSMKIPADQMLLGLYRGVPLTRKSVTAPAELPEQILIFQRNIEAVCSTRQDVVDTVRKTVLHELGHHFGFGEKELRELGY